MNNQDNNPADPVQTASSMSSSQIGHDSTGDNPPTGNPAFRSKATHIPRLPGSVHEIVYKGVQYRLALGVLTLPVQFHQWSDEAKWAFGGTRYWKPVSPACQPDVALVPSPQPEVPPEPPAPDCAPASPSAIARRAAMPMPAPEPSADSTKQPAPADPPAAADLTSASEVAPGRQRLSTYAKLTWATLYRLPPEYRIQVFYDQWGQGNEGGWCKHSSKTIAAALGIVDKRGRPRDAYVRRLRIQMVAAGHLETRTVRGRRADDKVNEYRSCQSEAELQRGQDGCDAWNAHIRGDIRHVMARTDGTKNSRALQPDEPKPKAEPIVLDKLSPRAALLEREVMPTIQRVFLKIFGVEIVVSKMKGPLMKAGERFAAEADDTKWINLTLTYLDAQMQLILRNHEKGTVEDPAAMFVTAVVRDWRKATEAILAGRTVKPLPE